RAVSAATQRSWKASVASVMLVLAGGSVFSAGARSRDTELTHPAFLGRDGDDRGGRRDVAGRRRGGGSLVPGVAQRDEDVAAGGDPLGVAGDVGADQLDEDVVVQVHQATGAVPGVQVQAGAQLVD